MKTLKKIWYILSPHERKNSVILIIMTLIMAMLETIGIASILPFMTALSNPSLIETDYYLKLIYNFFKIFGVHNNQSFLLALGIFVFILLILSICFKAITTYFHLHFVQMRQYSIGKRLMEGYLHQPYTWFLDRHSSDLGKTILSEVNQVVGNGINSLIELIAKIFVSFAIIALLFAVDTKISIIVGLSFSFSYFLVFLFTRKYLEIIGNERLKSNKLRFIALSDAFSAVKEIKILGLEKNYIKKFSKSSIIFAKSMAFASIIGQIPRFALEAIAFGGIFLIIFYMMIKTGNFDNALPIISLYVFAGYRLMPAIQQIYMSFTQLTFSVPSINKLYDEFKNFREIIFNQENQKILFNKEIKLKNINYKYPNSDRSTLKNINLSIPIGNTIGLIGKTGSGKTTTVDIILALLEPQNGSMEIDGKVLTKENKKFWQRSIGYVPQQIYLSEDTISSNIAFGVEEKKINYQDIEKVSRIANLHKFVSEDLPKKYQTNIGERGVRLSGGQRQRIGIARALYHNPKILILDEATSSLDNQTEKVVMEAVNNIGKDITIIIIAHRLNTVKNCDIIYELDKGEIINQGSYKDIIKD